MKGPAAASETSASTFPMSYGEAKLLHIPGTVLASIWNKASEYLSTPNTVIQVPSEEECIIRYSVHSQSTQNPNSVTFAEDGQMTCTCLMFKSSPNVCSHTVVAAQKANVLPAFLKWVTDTSAETNLYDVSTANVNRHAAGQKGEKARRLRQPPQPPPLTSVSPEEWLLPRGPANTQVGVVPVPLPMFMSQMQQYVGTGHVPLSFPATVTPQMTSQQPFASLPTTSSTPEGGRSPWHNNNPFVILLLTPRVKKCAGCSFLFRDLMGPPFIGLVIQQKENDLYRDKTGVLEISSEANHYYHCQSTCIMRRHPYFHARLLQLDAETLVNTALASELHRQFGLDL